MLKFNWRRGSNREFLGWLIPTLIAFISEDKMAEISTRSKKFTEVELTIQINGVEVDPAHFLRGVEKNMEHYTRLEAQEILTGSARLEKLRSNLDEVEMACNREIKEAMRELGFEIDLE